MPNLQHLYWDACVFLSYINGYQDRVQVLDAILDNASNEHSDKKIVTSVLTKVEVAYGASERQSKQLDTSIRDKIDALFQPGGPVIIVEVNERIADMARDLMRDGIVNEWHLKPADAIHLATAQWIKTTEFNTYDAELFKYSTAIGCDIREPHYTIQLKLLPPQLNL